MSELLDESRPGEAGRPDVLGGTRDALADERDRTADARDALADARDGIADAREAQLRDWQQRLEATARRLGLAPEDRYPDADLTTAWRARQESASERAARTAERKAAARAREMTAPEQIAQRLDLLLAAAFAAIAENLQDAATAEELLGRVAEAAVQTIAGATRATVALEQTLGGPEGATAAEELHADSDLGAVMSFPVAAPVNGEELRTASLNVYLSDPEGPDRAAQDIGFILAVHASLAARAIGDRLALHRVNEQLQEVLVSRDVIGQAKGILMERLRVTPEEAFEILKRSSQQLNIKLREIARTLAETGEILP